MKKIIYSLFIAHPISVTLAVNLINAFEVFEIRTGSIINSNISLKECLKECLYEYLKKNENVSNKGLDVYCTNLLNHSNNGITIPTDIPNLPNDRTLEFDSNKGLFGLFNQYLHSDIMLFN